jgi:dolichol-phosphate mannosyltransferase
MAAETLIIIPTYNERENLAAVAKAALDALPDADLLIVDDDSPDGTGKLGDELARGNQRIKVLHRESKLGLGRAYIAGFRWGLQQPYRYFVEMDADFSHDPRYLPDLVERARQGADLVLGSRYIAGGGTENWSLGRQVISRGGNRYASLVLGVGISDLTGGFKCFARRALEAIDLDAVHSNGYSFQIELTYRLLQRGYRVEELPITFVDRRVGQSKMSRRIVAEAIWMVWRLRFKALVGRLD